MADISMQMQYDSWLAIRDEVEAVKNQLSSGISVTDADVLAAVEDVVDRLVGVLSVTVQNWPATQAVKAADTDAELVQLKTELQEINTKLAGVLDVSDADAQTELQAVKAELEDIKTRLNAVLDVKLTGSNTVVKEFKGNTAMISNTLRAYGQSVTSGGSVVPLDVSEFKCKTIFLRNNHDKTIKVNVRFHADLISTSGGGILLTDKAAEVDVPAGQRMYITSCDYPTLKEPCVGLSVLLSASSAIASGSLDLIVLGGRT